VPNSTSRYTLFPINPNLLVDERRAPLRDERTEPSLVLLARRRDGPAGRRAVQPDASIVCPRRRAANRDG
jgi:hypothetical protein